MKFLTRQDVLFYSLESQSEIAFKKIIKRLRVFLHFVVIVVQ